MRYKIIFNKNSLPTWFKDGDPMELVVEDGKYERDFDLVTEGLDIDFIERIYDCAECYTSEYHMKYFGKEVVKDRVDQWLSLPIGADRNQLEAHGYKIVPITKR